MGAEKRRFVLWNTEAPCWCVVVVVVVVWRVHDVGGHGWWAGGRGVAVCEGGSVVTLTAVESWNYPACNGELSFQESCANLIHRLSIDCSELCALFILTSAAESWNDPASKGELSFLEPCAAPSNHRLSIDWSEPCARFIVDVRRGRELERVVANDPACKVSCHF